MKKRAVVLIVTIGFIAILTALILQTVSISKTTLDDLMIVKRQNQLMLLMQDSIKIINQMNNDFIDAFVESEEELPIQDEKSGLSLTLSCSYLKSKFDLNKLIKCNNQQCKNIIIDFAKKYELGSESYFLELLQKNYPFPTLKKINKIKEIYLDETRDFYINKITPKEMAKYFFVIDANTTTTISDLEPTSSVCELLDMKENKDECKKKFQKTVKLYIENNQTNQNNIKDLIKCKINLYNGDYTNSVIFKYNKPKKKIVSIDEFF